MSVTGPSYNINAINKLTESALSGAISDDISWHKQYQHSCYIFVGGLPFEMNEGDTACVFSQYGEIVDIHLVRDKKTGSFKGYGFIGYENQKSTILAVDNFNGYELLGRRLRVDHCDNFRAPKLDEESEGISQEYKPSGSEGHGFKVYGCVPSTKCLISSQQKNASSSFNPKASICKDADEMWAEEFEKQLQLMDEERKDTSEKLNQSEKNDFSNNTEKKNEKFHRRLPSREQTSSHSKPHRENRLVSKCSPVKKTPLKHECHTLRKIYVREES